MLGPVSISLSENRYFSVWRSSRPVMRWRHEAACHYMGSSSIHRRGGGWGAGRDRPQPAAHALLPAGGKTGAQQAVFRRRQACAPLCKGKGGPRHLPASPDATSIDSRGRQCTHMRSRTLAGVDRVAPVGHQKCCGCAGGGGSRRRQQGCECEDVRFGLEGVVGGGSNLTPLPSSSPLPLTSLSSSFPPQPCRSCVHACV